MQNKFKLTMSLKESAEKTSNEHPSLEKCSVSSVSQSQPEQSGGGGLTVSSSVKAHCFDNILALSQTDSQSIPSQPSLPTQEKKAAYSGLLVLSPSESENESSEKSSSLEMIEDVV